MADRMANIAEAPKVTAFLTREQAVEKSPRGWYRSRPLCRRDREAEANPAAVVEAVMKSGLMPLVRPKYWGGYGLDWMAFVDCIGEIGRTSGSIGWCSGFLMHHQWVLSHFPRKDKRLSIARTKIRKS